MGDAERINRVAALVAKHYEQGHSLVVVLSAMSGETDRLVGLAREFDNQPNPRELDQLLATGEQVTISLMCIALIKKGLKARSYTGGQVRILTDSAFNKARISEIDSARLKKDLDEGNILVVAGFQGVDQEGNITTLGRGGSDTTAVALAAALSADECQIYTDVDGVYTADPRIVDHAKRLEQLTYEEMLELSSLGAKVLQIRSVEFASKYSVPLRVLSSFEPEKGGTLITKEDETMEQALISGVVSNRDEAKLTVIGVPDQPGVAYRVLGPIAERNIEVDMIIQNVAEDSTTDLTFTVHRNDYEKALEILTQVADELKAKQVTGDTKIAKISVVGVGMRSHAGIASTMFETLAGEGINIKMISTSEIKISVVIDEKYLELAVRSLHSAFKLENIGT